MIIYQKFCLILLVIVGLLILISGFFSLIIIFILKPRRPIFSFETIDIYSYNFDVPDSSDVLLSTVASVTLITQNPNKIGIKYDFSKLQILDNGLVAGMIRIPEFYQPAGSHNLRVEIDILFRDLDVTSIMSGVEINNFTIKVLGDIGVHLHVMKIELPKIKVGLDCDVAVDGRYLISRNKISSLKAVKNYIAHFNAKSDAFSKKCSIGFYV
ncbi:uncharacterized protein LOC111906901 isoform X1 [Lactuca sativa]|uniref:uncharacterized protein LOC111906901 isoform X1 n=1 Tax=Lactuca sativa TaxID=4236 RepID=UPI000CD898BB|nr:uncharacterized protein LOC111906901 isoform X1 [Lactuca sativa]